MRNLKLKYILEGMESETKLPKEPVFPCKMCSMVFEIFKISLFIYFFIFISSVLLSKFPSPGDLIHEMILIVKKIGESTLSQFGKYER